MNEEHLTFALALQLVESYAAKRSELGESVTEKEAQLFMRNAVQLIHALLNSGVKPPTA